MVKAIIFGTIHDASQYGSKEELHEHFRKIAESARGKPVFLEISAIEIELYRMLPDFLAGKINPRMDVKLLSYLNAMGLLLQVNDPRLISEQGKILFWSVLINEHLKESRIFPLLKKDHQVTEQAFTLSMKIGALEAEILSLKEEYKRKKGKEKEAIREKLTELRERQKKLLISLGETFHTQDMIIARSLKKLPKEDFVVVVGNLHARPLEEHLKKRGVAAEVRELIPYKRLPKSLVRKMLAGLHIARKRAGAPTKLSWYRELRLPKQRRKL